MSKKMTDEEIIVALEGHEELRECTCKRCQKVREWRKKWGLKP